MWQIQTFKWHKTIKRTLSFLLFWRKIPHYRKSISVTLCWRDSSVSLPEEYGDPAFLHRKSSGFMTSCGDWQEPGATGTALLDGVWHHRSHHHRRWLKGKSLFTDLAQFVCVHQYLLIYWTHSELMFTVKMFTCCIVFLTDRINKLRIQYFMVHNFLERTV